MGKSAAALAEGIEHHQAGRLQQAEAIYRTILDDIPDHADALHLLGLIAFTQSQPDRAIELIREAIRSNPQPAVFYDNLGRILQDQKKVDEALGCFERLLERRPGDAEARMRLGNCYLTQQRLDEAGQCFRQVLAMQPESVEARVKLAYILRRQGEPGQAISLLREALERQPDYTDALLTLAASLYDEGQDPEAAATCSRLLELCSDLADAHHLLGLIHKRQCRFEDSLAHNREALRLRPDHAVSHNNLGVTLLDQGRVAEAIDAFREAVRLQPDYAAAHSNILLSLNYLPCQDPAAVFAEHLKWNDQHAAPRASFRRPHSNDPTPDRRLRIGYLSPDFRTHPVAFFFGPILDTHDRSAFECYCYSAAQQPDAVTQSVRAFAHVWREIRPLSDEQVADLIRRDGIDILVDLAGHTGDNRLTVFARRPAPVQVSYLGYPNTTGMKVMDYRLTDQWADPPGASDRLHTEKLVRLHGGFLCYRPLAGGPLPAAPPFSTTGVFTFGCFNALQKVTDQALAAWARILEAAPQARLLLKAKALAEEGARQRVLETFRQHDVRPERIVLRSLVRDLYGHAQTYNEVDLALDTFPYNGTTTTCEALWMGMPVVTLAGRTHASRVGCSLLSRMGLEEFIADSVDQYVELAASLARNPQRLGQLRVDLRDRMARSSLTDAPGFVRELEQAYRWMWGRWCQQQPRPARAAARKPTAEGDDLRRRVAAFPYWYHRIELPGGVATPGWAPLNPEAYRVPASLAGKRVLDVGAWDGYWTFQALERGAHEVVAIDDFSDLLGQLPPGHRRGWETFDFCREALAYGVECCQRQEVSVYDVSEARLGRFDVVFFFATLYHLRHPLLALERLAAVCDGEIYVESAVLDDYSPYRGGLGHGYADGQMVMEFYPDSQYGDNATNWWVPTLHCLGHMVRSAGFPEVEAWKLTATPPGHLAVCRGFVKGTKPPD